MDPGVLACKLELEEIKKVLCEIKDLMKNKWTVAYAREKRVPRPLFLEALDSVKEFLYARAVEISKKAHIVSMFDRTPLGQTQFGERRITICITTFH